MYYVNNWATVLKKPAGDFACPDAVSVPHQINILRVQALTTGPISRE